MKVPAILIALLAIATVAVPLATNCQANGMALTLANGNQVPMKCFWTAMAEIGVGVPLLGVAGLLAFSKRKEGRRNLSVMGVVLGAFAMLFPTALIGVCANPAHACNMVMLPTLMFSGALTIAISLGTLVYSQRTPEAIA